MFDFVSFLKNSKFIGVTCSPANDIKINRVTETFADTYVSPATTADL